MEERGTQEITTELDLRHGHLIIQVDLEHRDNTSKIILRWALWANSGTVGASRGFTGLQIGDSINFDIEHTPTINGEVGLTLSKNGTDVFNLKFAGGGSSWTVWDSFSGTYGLSQGYEANTPLSFNFEVIGNFEYSLDFGSPQEVFNLQVKTSKVSIKLPSTIITKAIVKTFQLVICQLSQNRLRLGY